MIHDYMPYGKKLLFMKILIGVVIFILAVGGVIKSCDRIDESNKETICYFSTDLETVRTSDIELSNIKTPIVKLTYHHNLLPTNFAYVEILNLKSKYDCYFWNFVSDRPVLGGYDHIQIKLVNKNKETFFIKLRLSLSVDEMKVHVLPVLEALSALE